jgi:hypothetical protein
LKTIHPDVFNEDEERNQDKLREQNSPMGVSSNLDVITVGRVSKD